MHFHVRLKLPHSEVSDKRVSVEQTNIATWQYHETKLPPQLWADRYVQEKLSSSKEINHYGTICPKK